MTHTIEHQKQAHRIPKFKRIICLQRTLTVGMVQNHCRQAPGHREAARNHIIGGNFHVMHYKIAI